MSRTPHRRARPARGPRAPVDRPRRSTCPGGADRTRPRRGRSGRRLWRAGSAIPRATTRASSETRIPAASRPSMSTRPDVGRSSPSRCSSSVVLPLPFGPVRTTDLAGGDDKVDAIERADRPGEVEGHVLQGDRRHRVGPSTPTGSSPAPATAGSASTSPTGPTGPRRPSRSTATRSQAADRSRVSADAIDDGEAAPGQAAHDRDQALGRVEVEVGRRLVEHEVPGAHRQHGGDREPLLLARREPSSDRARRARPSPPA